MPLRLNKTDTHIVTGDTLVRMIEKKAKKNDITKKTVGLIRNEIKYLIQKNTAESIKMLNDAEIRSTSIKSVTIKNKLKKIFSEYINKVENSPIVPGRKDLGNRNNAQLNNETIKSGFNNIEQNLDVKNLSCEIVDSRSKNLEPKSKKDKTPSMDEKPSIMEKIKKAILDKKINSEDNIETILIKSKSEGCLSGDAVIEINKRINIIKDECESNNGNVIVKLKELREYHIGLSLPPMIQNHVSNIFDIIINNIQVKARFNLNKFNISATLGDAHVSKDKINEILNGIDNGIENVKDMIAPTQKMDLINKILIKNKGCLINVEVERFIKCRLSQSNDDLEKELLILPTLSISDAKRLLDVKNKIFTSLNKNNLKNDEINKFLDFLYDFKNKISNTEGDLNINEVVKRIELTTEHINYMGGSVTNYFVTQSFDMKSEDLEKEVSKLRYNELSYLGKVKYKFNQLFNIIIKFKNNAVERLSNYFLRYN